MNTPTSSDAILAPAAVGGTLRVIEFNGAAPAKPLGFDFDLRGGTVGRADTNKLVLADATVSRVHAQIVNRQGTFVVISRGRNPLMVDEVAIDAGDELPLHDGGTVRIGNFLLKAGIRVVAAAAPSAAEQDAAARRAKGEAFGGGL